MQHIATGFPASSPQIATASTGRMVTVRKLCALLRMPRLEAETLIRQHSLPVDRSHGVARVGVLHVSRAMDAANAVD